MGVAGAALACTATGGGAAPTGDGVLTAGSAASVGRVVLITGVAASGAPGAPARGARSVNPLLRREKKIRSPSLQAMLFPFGSSCTYPPRLTRVALVPVDSRKHSPSSTTKVA